MKTKKIKELLSELSILDQTNPGTEKAEKIEKKLQKIGLLNDEGCFELNYKKEKYNKIRNWFDITWCSITWCS